MSRRACSAVTAAIGTPAACSNVMRAGFSWTLRAAFTTTYSANAPFLPPNTSSPGLKLVTLLPTASTVPEKSTPSRWSFGRKKPDSRRMMYGTPRM